MVLGIAGLGILAWGILLPSGAHAAWTTATAGWFGSTSQLGWINGISGTDRGTTDFISLVRSFVNWILGLISLIALLMALYGGFKMVTSAGDDGKYKDGFKVLKNAAIGLIIIGLSWIIVSSVFWLISSVWSTATAGTTGTLQ